MKSPFKTTSIAVGLIMSLLALSLFAKGLLPTMTEYGVPLEIISAPHYIDAISWVYIHMAVIGFFIAIFGYSVTDISKQKWIAISITLILSFYTYLDFIHSDSPVGNALYKGSQSIIPAIISLLMTIAFLRLTIKLFRSK
jgi:hypothetical protein